LTGSVEHHLPKTFGIAVGCPIAPLLGLLVRCWTSFMTKDWCFYLFDYSQKVTCSTHLNYLP
jgi:hypothetical protein